jgi:hypothetical protein
MAGNCWAFEALAAQGYRQEDIAIGCLEESRPQNRAHTVRVWSFEKSPKAIKNTTHFKSNTLGFYAIVGNSVQSFLEDSKKEAIAGLVQSGVTVCKGSHCLPAVEWEVQLHPLPEGPDHGYRPHRYTLLS